jgi:hypothetical protein
VLATSPFIPLQQRLEAQRAAQSNKKAQDGLAVDDWPVAASFRITEVD